MIKIEATQDLDLINKIMFDEELVEYTTYDDCPTELEELAKGASVLIVYKDEEPIGYFALSPISSVSYWAHFSILPKYWGKKLSLKVVESLREYLSQFTYKLLKVVFLVPKSKFHVQSYLYSIDAHLDGTLKHGISIDGKLEDLYMFSIDIKGVN